MVGGGKLQKDFPEVTTVAKFIPLSKIGTFRTISSSFVLCWLGKKKKKEIKHRKSQWPFETLYCTSKLQNFKKHKNIFFS